MEPLGSAKSLYLASDDAIWLSERLDKSLPAAFLLQALFALEKFVTSSGSKIQVAEFSVSLDDAKQILVALAAIEHLAVERKRFTAARIAQAWASAIRIGVMKAAMPISETSALKESMTNTGAPKRIGPEFDAKFP